MIVLPIFEQYLTAELRRVRPMLLRALDQCGGTHDFDDVVYLIRRRLAHLWPGERSVIVTEIIEAPNLRYCSIWLAGGDLTELLEMEKRVAAWAREQGCKRIIANGRGGWAKVLTDYRTAFISYEKEL